MVNNMKYTNYEAKYMNNNTNYNSTYRDTKYNSTNYNTTYADTKYNGTEAQYGPFKRGDVWWVKMPAYTLKTAQKVRPCVIVSNDIANAHDNNITIVPLTHSVKRLDIPSNVPVNSQKGMARCNAVMTVGKELIVSKIGTLTQWEMQHITTALYDRVCGN